MNQFKRILLAENSPKDVELTLAALEGHHLANEVIGPFCYSFPLPDSVK